MMPLVPTFATLGSSFLLLVCVFVSTTTALSSSPQEASRRAFVFGRIPTIAAAAVVTGGFFVPPPPSPLHSTNAAAFCSCDQCSRAAAAVPNKFFLFPPAANAYERRDVGGADASPVTKAMNDQAYETNNRLERAGFKLDVRIIAAAEKVWASLYLKCGGTTGTLHRYSF